MYKDYTYIVDESNPEWFAAADVKRDGIISVSDVTLIQRFVAGMIDKFA